MMHVFCVMRKDRIDGIDETLQVSPLIFSENREAAYKRACLFLKEEVEKDSGLSSLLNLPALTPCQKEADERARKIGYNGDEMREDYAFIAHWTPEPYDVDFSELKVEECINIEIV